MADYKGVKMWSGDECLNYQNPPNVSQRITNIAANTAITLSNPSKIANATNTAGLVFVLVGSETTYRPVYLAAGQMEELDVRSVGLTGTTITDIMVWGRE